MYDIIHYHFSSLQNTAGRYHSYLSWHWYQKKKKKQTRLPITETLLNFGADIPMDFQKALDELWIQSFLTVLPSLHLS